MPTFHIPITCEDITGTTFFRVKARKYGDTTWVVYTSSGGHSFTFDFVGISDTLYDFQVQNVNDNDNPLSLIHNSISFSDVNLLLSPTDRSVGFTFASKITNVISTNDNVKYIIQITSVADPSTIIVDGVYQISTIGETINDSTGSVLTAGTQYRFVVTVVVNEFITSFTHYFTTLSEGETCAPPTTASITIT